MCILTAALLTAAHLTEVNCQPGGLLQQVGSVVRRPRRWLPRLSICERQLSTLGLCMEKGHPLAWLVDMRRELALRASCARPLGSKPASRAASHQLRVHSSANAALAWRQRQSCRQHTGRAFDSCPVIQDQAGTLMAAPRASTSSSAARMAMASAVGAATATGALPSRALAAAGVVASADGHNRVWTSWRSWRAREPATIRLQNRYMASNCERKLPKLYVYHICAE